VNPFLQQLDARAARLYAHLQDQGILLDGAALHQLLDSSRAALTHALSVLERLTGFRPNPNSPHDYVRIARQAGQELPRTPSGRPRTAASITAQLGHQIPALALLTNARRLRRKVSLLSGLARRLRGGRVFPTYWLDPELGRAHAGGAANPMNWEPDLQRLVTVPGKWILVADYQRLELKVLATLSSDPQLQRDLQHDPYLAAARSLFQTPNPSPAQRAQAKTATLASVYGQSPRGLATQLHVPIETARQLQWQWAQRYPHATAYLRLLVDRGRATGQALSYHGRTKLIPTDRPLDARDRLAINSPIQNTAGDLARIGFCHLFEDGRTRQLGLELITTVHDAIVLASAHGTDLEPVRAHLQDCLVDRNDPAFGLSIAIKVGANWADAHT
jgi:DNA polymerase I-like protein with 3'-5' exonuclease and polymerase domains